MTATSAPEVAVPPRRVGILGGMFDPIHHGHLQAASLAREWCALDEVLLVPCGQPVHRAAALTSASQRCAMIELAIAEQAWLRLDRRECDSGEPSRTWSTLHSLQVEHKGRILYFVLGMDAFLSLPTWYRWRELFELAHFIVIRRPGESGELPEPGPELAAICEGRWVFDPQLLPAAAAGAVIVVPQASRVLSSTQVRDALVQGADISALVPAKVAEYIRVHHLYS